MFLFVCFGCFFCLFSLAIQLICSVSGGGSVSDRSHDEADGHGATQDQPDSTDPSANSQGENLYTERTKWADMRPRTSFGGKQEIPFAFILLLLL
jgi:hypothetical protein